MSETRSVVENGLVRVLNLETDGRIGELSVGRIQQLLKKIKDVDVLCLTGMKACTDKALERFDAELSKAGFGDRILRTQPSEQRTHLSLICRTTVHGIVCVCVCSFRPR